METKDIPAELLEEIERRSVQYAVRFEDAPIKAITAVAQAYSACAKYWVGRMLAERDAMEKALIELSQAAGLFAAKQKLGGNLKEARDRLSGALWESDKVLTANQKVADQNARAAKKEINKK